MVAEVDHSRGLGSGQPIGLHTAQVHTEHPSYPIAIPPEKLAKALQLYICYRLEESLEVKRASTDVAGAFLDVPPPRRSDEAKTSYSASSTASRLSGIDGSLLSSFDESSSLSAAREFSSYDGKKVKARTRSKLSPKARAKAALIRYIGSCSVCRNRRAPCPLEHHDIDSLERERLKVKTKPSERVARRLRCHFNARYPHRFCATRSTGNKYHVCSKEGYLTISHLK
jgi:hypothetical protein